VAELIRLNVDVIVTSGSGVTRAAKETMVTIPIVMTQDNDPVGSGIASLARPGGNVTGLSNLAPELSGKRLELLREIIPKLAGVAVFGTSTNPANAQSLEETELAAGAFGIKLQYLNVLNSKTSRPHSDPQARGGLTQTLYLWQVPSSIHTEQNLRNSRKRAGSRRSTAIEKMWRPAGLCPTG
jgi:ABC-type uncharacterized transport system substrate-binding protein